MCNEHHLKVSAKRAVFTGIQHSSTIAAHGYHVLPYGTGGESLLAQGVSEIFAKVAEEDGKVLSVDDDVIVIEYKSGKKKAYRKGLQFGKAEGKLYPHNVVTQLKPGDKVKSGDGVIYNDSFFEPDPMDKTTLLWKGGVLLRTAQWESNTTFEDSNTISSAVVGKLFATASKTRDLVLDFNTAVYDLVKPGAEVDSDSILCTLEEKLGDESLFGDDRVDRLKELKKQNPKADYKGTVKKIEVYYYGDKSDMDPSIRKLANAYDKEVKELYGKLGKKITSAQVDGSMRIEGKPMQQGKVLVRVFINIVDDVKTGDKFVVANQLKTTTAELHSPEVTSEDGEPIELIFGAQSDNDRIVESPKEIGMMNTILVLLSKQAADAYFGE